MKHPLFATVVFLGATVAGWADPATDLDTAIRGVLKQPNFSWRVTFERTDTGRKCAYDGKTARGGYTVVTTARRNLIEAEIPDDSEQLITIVYSGDRSVANVNRSWLTPRELHALLFPRPPGVLDAVSAASARVAALSSVPGARTTSWQDEGRIAVPRPDLILSHLLGALENVHPGNRTLVGEVDRRGATVLFDSNLAAPTVDPGWHAVRVVGPTRRTVNSSKTGTTREILPAPDTPQRAPHVQLVSYSGASGEGTFWLVDGALVKFELRLEAVEHRRGQAEGAPHHVAITAVIDDVGSTSVDVPAGAQQRLAQ